MVGDQRDVKITRQLHLDYLPTIPSALILSLSLSTKLIFKGEQKMNSDRLKGPLENSPTTPQPSPAISCLFFFSSLQINYFVRGEKRRKRELAGGPPFVCAHRESQARRFISGCWLHSSFFWSFSPFFIIIISSVFNRRRRRSFSFFLSVFFSLSFFSTWKDLVNYCFLPLRNEAATRKKKENENNWHKEGIVLMRSYSFHFQTDISINPFLFLNI